MRRGKGEDERKGLGKDKKRMNRGRDMVRRRLEEDENEERTRRGQKSTR